MSNIKETAKVLQRSMLAIYSQSAIDHFGNSIILAHSFLNLARLREQNAEQSERACEYWDGCDIGVSDRLRRNAAGLRADAATFRAEASRLDPSGVAATL